MKNVFGKLLIYIKILTKWLLLATVVGISGGAVGTAFHFSVDLVTNIRNENTGIIFFLPIGGCVICLLYSLFESKGKLDTNRVIKSVVSDEDVPFVTAPLIFVSTCITHLLGGSVGREGAALQIGGSIGSLTGKLFRLNQKDKQIIVMSGMSAVFSALFGTPVTATFFSLEVSQVGAIRYFALIPCLLSAIIGFYVAEIFGVSPVRFEVPHINISAEVLMKAFVIAVLCAAVSFLFCKALRIFEKYGKRFIRNEFFRAFIGGSIIAFLTFFLQSFDYNGAGMNVISRAITGEVKAEAFLLKILFTVITVAAGFKGGEIVPAFFIGATFGCVIGSVIGLDAGFSAALGFVALFCGTVNCPIASILLSVEVFGGDCLILFSFVCAVTYMMSGKISLYESQRILCSKINND